MPKLLKQDWRVLMYEVTDGDETEYMVERWEMTMYYWIHHHLAIAEFELCVQKNDAEYLDKLWWHYLWLDY
jgi:hypothetical protein